MEGIKNGVLLVIMVAGILIQRGYRKIFWSKKRYDDEYEDGGGSIF